MDTESLAEVDVILGMMSPEDLARIPEKFINFIKLNKSSDYLPSIQSDIPISEQPLKPYTKVLCSIIYRNYLCSNEQKELLEQQDKELIEKLQEERRAEYRNLLNHSSVQDNKLNENIPVESSRDTQLIEIKPKGLLASIIDKIKSLFHKK